jgi:hypothetical protein
VEEGAGRERVEEGRRVREREEAKKRTVTVMGGGTRRGAPEAAGRGAKGEGGGRGREVAKLSDEGNYGPAGR